MKLPVGKYKHLEIDEIDDLSYLRWAEENLDLSSPMREAVLDQIGELCGKPRTNVQMISELNVLKATKFLLTKTEGMRDAQPVALAQQSIKEMYRMLTGKDYT